MLIHRERKYTNKNIAESAIHIFEKAPILKKKIGAFLEIEEITTEELFEETLKFLYLVGKYKTSLTPSYLVDMAWHEFILCTRLYFDFCEHEIGRYIHHTPDDNTEKNQSNFTKTLKFYILHFGTPKAHIWGDWAFQEGLESDCGSCLSQ